MIFRVPAGENDCERSREICSAGSLSPRAEESTRALALV